MFLSKRKVLSLPILCALASVGFVADVHAEETMRHDMHEVVIEGDKDLLPGGFASETGAVGMLGEKEVMEVPFSQVNLTAKAIEKFGGPNQPIQSVLVNAPSVRVRGTTLHNDISIRGIRCTGTSFYLNGVPGMMTQFNAPTFAIGDIEFISGPNSGIMGVPSTYETSTAGGIVNYVSKKATNEPITSYKQVFSGKSSLGEYLDVSRRFGKDNEWGVRINTEVVDGETAIDNHKITSRGVVANIDYTKENHVTNLVTGYRDHDIKGGIHWFGLANVGTELTKLPDAPDASKDYGFDGIEKAAEGYFFTLNHEHEFAEGWKWFANAGFNHNKLKKNISGNGSRFTIINNAGDIGPVPGSKDNNMYSSQTVTENNYAQLGMKGEFSTGDIKHDVSLAIEKAWYSIEGSKDSYNGKMGKVHGNIYTGIIVDGFWKPEIETKQSSKNFYWGASLADTMTYGKAQVIVGVHKHENESKSYDKVGNFDKSVKSDAICPTYGVVYQPDEHFSIYGNHTENFDKGVIVPDDKNDYKNKGDVLDPAKTKQNEFGVKYSNGGMVTSLGIFEITQANNFEVQKSDGLYFLQDGEEQYKGVELSINGRIAPKWNFMGGLMYLDATQEKTKKGLKDGLSVEGACHWNAVAALEYQASDDFSVIGRVLYNDEAKMFDEQITVPSFVTYDLGVNYQTEIFRTPVNLTAMCYNVTDKNYWTAHSNRVLLSNPRTFMVSATFDI